MPSDVTKSVGESILGLCNSMAREKDKRISNNPLVKIVKNLAEFGMTNTAEPIDDMLIDLSAIFLLSPNLGKNLVEAMNDTLSKYKEEVAGDLLNALGIGDKNE